jgi:hypothetical protein
MIGEYFPPCPSGLFHRIVVGNRANLPGTTRTFMLNDAVMLHDFEGKTSVTPGDSWTVAKREGMRGSRGIIPTSNGKNFLADTGER